MPPIPSRQSSRRSTSVPPPPRKKALVIGIGYKDHSTTDGSEAEFGRLYGPHRDATNFKDMLINKKGRKATLRPTRNNIMREVMNFTVGAHAGDTYVFYFCGHSGQIDTGNPTEDDGMDEVILPLDHEGLNEEKVIFDNDLRKYLVDPLPAGARLIAVFDSCHSGTLLDLDHYDCNTIFQPWVSKGYRRPRSLWAYNDRKNALYHRASGGRIVTAQRTTSHEVSTRLMDVTAPSPSSYRPIIRGRAASVASEKTTLNKVASLTEIIEGLQLKGTSPAQPFFSHEDIDSDPFPQCMSPVSERVCNGDCPESPTLKPEVISLSSCTDGQVAWESDASMTQALIKVLDHSPCPTFQELLQQVGFQLHKMGMELHNWSRERRESYKKKMHDKNKENRPSSVDNMDVDSLELVNFQEPQVGDSSSPQHHSNLTLHFSPQLGSQKRLNMLSHFIL
ncbi:hypothetical protein NLI96_g2946 [Meripilus lineatus]|uniref:Peptidase C14 caspase domain-containing protein n=1 Tax=Meripilus lineatus TaxID=2056292 RepID=A0AAD5VD85_9APHY|nr:hypothetical protein NLI96_g2946 [Physisporinus lineatus]